ncbi:glycoside hydrolase family 27 protein [Streptantibioticus ferralitis]|uniref:Alpha-galactosidase n=1 Tax=Streptantibioticus ferralitis TaxID=236510 RepID=A0ABT5YVR1_9ACTN|nr:glycoside hydrolase family 27 protein [Streptantibioticus ferralitis]MDF2255702.1 glycoside hydrolase family 27 protein [Streptantibioticus ferralitis]
MFAKIAVAAALALASPAVAHTAPVPSSGYHGLAATPPMGWNDWSYYQCNIDQKLILDQGRALVRSGLAVKGYNTVTTDDCWMTKTRDASGNLVSDPQKFPDGMAYVGRQLHAMGLKFGIYEDAGTQTCGGYAGSWQHYDADARLFAKWGVDYLKLDGCNVPSIPGQSGQETYRQAYAGMSQALQHSGRKIVFSESAPAYFQGTSDWYTVLGWVARYGNLWREGTDIALGQESGAAKWKSLLGNYDYNAPLVKYAGPGHWNDPDFLLVGDSGLTADEMQTQLTLWAEMSAPLISSTDLTKLSPQALSILGNRDIIAVDQDRAGVQGTRVVHTGTHDVLTKPLAGGDRAVVFLNRGDAPLTIGASAGTLGFGKAQHLSGKDLVTKRTSSYGSSVTVQVRPHATVMLRLRAAG